MKTRILMTSLVASLSLGLLASSSVFAQSATVQRDVSQQTRIEQGLKSGSLSTAEAARLDNQQAHIDRLQAQDLKDGKLSHQEKEQLKTAQSRADRDIHADKTNQLTANPHSVSSRRMQADVASNINQQKRIDQGLNNGTLNRHEVGKLEHSQAKSDRKEAAAGINGHISASEQAAVQHIDKHQSRRIHRDKEVGEAHQAG